MEEPRHEAENAKSDVDETVTAANAALHPDCCKVSTLRDTAEIAAIARELTSNGRKQNSENAEEEI